MVLYKNVFLYKTMFIQNHMFLNTKPYVQNHMCQLYFQSIAVDFFSIILPCWPNIRSCGIFLVFHSPRQSS